MPSNRPVTIEHPDNVRNPLDVAGRNNNNQELATQGSSTQILSATNPASSGTTGQQKQSAFVDTSKPAATGAVVATTTTGTPPPSTPPTSTPAPAAVTSLSLQAIIVVACGIFAFVTSFVSFYLQYDFFLNEYSSQMEGRIGYYSEMFGNQINVKSNSNASSIAHITTTAVFDAYDGIANVNPSVSNPSSFQWYVLQSYTMFASGLTIKYIFPSSGTTLSMASYSFTVDICSDVGGGVFMQMTWILDSSLNPSSPISAPIPCVDGRLGSDVATILTNATAYTIPRLGQSIPFDHFLYSGVSVNSTTGAAMFIMSVVMRAAAVLEWGSVAPSVEAYYFDDNGAFVGTSRTDIAVNVNTTIYNIGVPYLQAVVVPKLQAVGFLTPSPSSLQGQFFEYEYDGFAWGYHELPMPTLSGRPWRIVLIDTTHTDLTGSTPKRTGGLIIAGGTVAALVLCALIFHVWFAPLSDLAARVRSSSGVSSSNNASPTNGSNEEGKDADMGGGDGGKSAAQTNADILSKPMAFTVFTEIARAQEAFLNVQESLQEIQSYIPQSLQHHPGDAATTSGPMMMVDNIGVVAGGGSSNTTTNNNTGTTNDDAGTRDITNPTTPTAEERNANAADLNSSNNNLVERIGAGDTGSNAGDAQPMVAVVDPTIAVGHPGANMSSLIRQPVDTVLPQQQTNNDTTPVSRPASSSAAILPAGGSRPGSSHHNPNALGLLGDNTNTNHFGAANGNMLPCRMTTLHLRLHRFAKWTVAVPFLEMAATCICQHNGVLDTVDYGSITATFNCHRQCPTHEKNAVDAALEIQRAARKDPRFQAIMAESPFSIGIDTDIAVALTVGFEDIKARVVIGPGFELARKLSTLAYDIANADILVTGSVAVATSAIPSMIVDYIQPRRDHIQMLAGAGAGAGTTTGSSRSDGSSGEGKSVHEVVGMNVTPGTGGTSNPSVNHSNNAGPRAPSRQSEVSNTTVQEINLSTQNCLDSYRIAFASMRQGAYEDSVDRFTKLIEQLENSLVDAPPLNITQSRNHGGPAGDVVSRTSGSAAGHNHGQRRGSGQSGGGGGANLSMLDVEVQTTMLKQSRRLLNICSNRKDNGGPSERYIRAERCPWDVLPVERELCAETADGALPSFLFQQPTSGGGGGASGNNNNNGGAGAANGGGRSRAGDSLATGSVAADPTLIAGNASFGTEWSRSQL